MQRAIPIIYKGITLDAHYRVDLIVEDLVVVEVKSVDRLLPVPQAQVLTYMGLSGAPAGLLIDFNVPKLIDGVKRVIAPPVNALRAECPPEAGVTGGKLIASVSPLLRVIRFLRSLRSL